jgi:DNA modification methylase
MTEIVVGDARVVLGDCRDVLKTLADNSVDSVVTDPPYELGFMGKSWDSTGIAYDVTVWEECLRVLKPGGHILAFGGSRTWHRLAVAVEDAGFEIRDSIAWIYGSGFPKSLDVSKAIDKSDAKVERRVRDLRFVNWMRSTGLRATEINTIIGKADVGSHYLRIDQPVVATAELFDRLRPHLPVVPDDIERLVFDRTVESKNFAEREVIGQNPNIERANSIKTGNIRFGAKSDGSEANTDVTAPSTAEAQQWAGWGTALKPAFEPIVVGRKPFGKGVTVAENVLAWGVGGLNIDGSRIGTEKVTINTFDNGAKPFGGAAGEPFSSRQSAGRWPANVILDEVTAGLLDEQSGNRPSAGTYLKPDEPMKIGSRNGNNDPDKFLNNVYLNSKRYNTYSGEQGGASRFFYQAKASKRDRNEGLEGLETKRAGSLNMRTDAHSVANGMDTGSRQNFHPTVKPTQLMRYLIKLVTPPGGTVLDPFTGSGSTGKAALLDGYKFVGAELTAEYLPIIEGRLRWALEHADVDETLF